MGIELPSDYYLNNFLEFIDHVFPLYDDLLLETELYFYTSFKKLNRDAQKLFVRMLMRKGNYFRNDKLHYAEIADHCKAAKTLSQNGFITIDPELDVCDALSLFNRHEWIEILTSDGLVDKTIVKLKRSELDHYITTHYSQHRPVFPDVSIYKIKDPALFETIKLLFFGNTHQDLSEFVLRDLGLYTYENYSIDDASRLFESRMQIESHLSFYELTSGLDAIEEASASDIITFFKSLNLFRNIDPILERRVLRAGFRLARHLERREEFEEALHLYQQLPTSDARQRQARALVKLNQHQSAFKLCKDILESPFNEEELNFARNFGTRIAKKLKKPFVRPLKFQVNENTLCIASTTKIELEVAEHLSKSAPTFYVENSLFCSVFSLHFWDVIFAPVRGAFTHPFQSRPHDLYEVDFLQLRQTLYEECLSILGNQTRFREHILDMARKKQGLVTPLMYRTYSDEALLNKALEYIPTAHWHAIFKRMWSDLRANRNGFPDLIQFREDGSYQLIEVKGPGDTLQNNQKRWLHYFSENNIPYEVLKVEWL